MIQTSWIDVIRPSRNSRSSTLRIAPALIRLRGDPW